MKHYTVIWTANDEEERYFNIEAGSPADASDACYYENSDEVEGYEEVSVTESMVTLNGEWIRMDTVVHYMDDEICMELNEELAPCSDQKFVDAYCKAHEEKFGETFEIN